MAYNDILSLNVGGTRFDTTRQTLLRDPGSMLARMFQPQSQLAPAQIKNEGYFIDRDPEMFKIILNYLRSDYLEEMTNSNILKLQVEAEYFQMSSLQKIINQRKDANIIVNGKIFRCKGYALKYCKKELIDHNGDFVIPLKSFICPNQKSDCKRFKGISANGQLLNSFPCSQVGVHGITLEDLVRRIVTRLENSTVYQGPLQSGSSDDLLQDSVTAQFMGLIPVSHFFY